MLPPLGLDGITTQSVDAGVAPRDQLLALPQLEVLPSQVLVVNTSLKAYALAVLPPSVIWASLITEGVLSAVTWNVNSLTIGTGPRTRSAEPSGIVPVPL